MGQRADARRIVSLARGLDSAATVVIGIDGRSGTGKTTTATTVAQLLGAQVVHMDDLYPGWHGLADAVPVLVREVLEPIGRGEHAAYRRYDWQQQAYADPQVAEARPFLVIEGCGCTTGDARLRIDVRVWLEAPLPVRRARGLERDGDAFRPMWSVWSRQEDALFDPDRTRAHAHLVLRTGENVE